VRKYARYVGGAVMLLCLSLFIIFFAVGINLNFDQDRVYSFLVLGLDDVDEGRHADAVISLYYKKTPPRMAIISWPRDMLVRLDGVKAKLGSLYKLRGSEFLRARIERFSASSFDAEFILDFKAFRSLVNHIGGVRIYNPQRLRYEDRSAGLKIDIPRGYVYLSANKALEFLRFRNDARGDRGRVERQQKFLMNLIRSAFLQAAEKDGIFSKMSLARIIVHEVETDLSEKSMADLFALVLSHGIPEFRSIFVEGKTLPGRVSFLSVGENDIRKAFKVRDAFFNAPSVPPLTRIRVRILNATRVPKAAFLLGRKLRGTMIDVIDIGNYEKEVAKTFILDHTGKSAGRRVKEILGHGDVISDYRPYAPIPVTVILGKDLVEAGRSGP